MVCAAFVCAFASRAAATPVARHRVPSRGPWATLSYRYMSLPASGTDGTTHAVGAMVFPLRSLARVRALRWGVGVESAWRERFGDDADMLVQVVTSAGWQRPGRWSCLYVAALVGVGATWGARSEAVEGVLTTGAEIGVDWRLGGPWLGVAIGIGRSTEGQTANDSAWVRLGVSAFGR